MQLLKVSVRGVLGLAGLLFGVLVASNNVNFMNFTDSLTGIPQNPGEIASAKMFIPEAFGTFLAIFLIASVLGTLILGVIIAFSHEHHGSWINIIKMIIQKGARSSLLGVISVLLYRVGLNLYRRTSFYEEARARKSVETPANPRRNSPQKPTTAPKGYQHSEMDENEFYRMTETAAKKTDSSADMAVSNKPVAISVKKTATTPPKELASSVPQRTKKEEAPAPILQMRKTLAQSTADNQAAIDNNLLALGHEADHFDTRAETMNQLSSNLADGNLVAGQAETCVNQYEAILDTFTETQATLKRIVAKRKKLLDEGVPPFMQNILNGPAMWYIAENITADVTVSEDDATKVDKTKLPVSRLRETYGNPAVPQPGNLAIEVLEKRAPKAILAKV